MKNIKLDTLSISDNRWIKPKIITYGDEVYTNLCGLNVLEDDAECESLFAYDDKC